MKKSRWLGVSLCVVLLASLSGCATNDELSSDSTSATPKTSVPGQDRSGEAGGVVPSANAGGAAANVRF
jgi:hypothetical protein